MKLEIIEMGVFMAHIQAHSSLIVQIKSVELLDPKLCKLSEAAK